MLSTFQVWQAQTTKGAFAGDLNRTRLIIQVTSCHWQIWWTSFDPGEPSDPAISRVTYYERSCFDYGFSTREEALNAMFAYDYEIGCTSVLIWEGL